MVDPEQTLALHLFAHKQPDCCCAVCQVLAEYLEETFGGEPPKPAEAADAQVDGLRHQIQALEQEMRGWPITQCHSETGVDVGLVMLNPETLERWANTLSRLIGGHDQPPRET